MKQKQQQLRCPYCGSIAILREGSYVYENPKIKHLYVCSQYPACDSFVSAHEYPLTPMGTLANKTLRTKRRQAHHMFDQLWQKGIFTRRNAYLWIGDKFCLKGQHAHIGEFSEYLCEQLILECQKVLQNWKEQKSERRESECI